MTTTEQARVRRAHERLDHHHRKAFGVPHPPETKPARPSLPPNPAHWPGPNLPVEHRAGCATARLESTAWHEATSGARLLVTTHCVDCGAAAQRRFPDAP